MYGNQMPLWGEIAFILFAVMLFCSFVIWIVDGYRDAKGSGRYVSEDGCCLILNNKKEFKLFNPKNGHNNLSIYGNYKWVDNRNIVLLTMINGTQQLISGASERGKIKLLLQSGETEFVQT